MRSPVHILVTLRQPALRPMAELVFRTLRTGFPTAPVCVWGNGLNHSDAERAGAVARAAGATFQNLYPTSHDAWVEGLIASQAAPFWICDTDMVFLAECEWFHDSGDGEVLLAGRYEPGWHEPFTKTFHVERLHTCLQWFNPQPLRGAMQRWCMDHVPAIFSNIQVPFIRQHFIPRLGDRPLFYDTTAGLFHCFGGSRFTDLQNQCFEHLHCGTYGDVVGAVPALQELPAVHAAVVADPGKARGLQQVQNEFYRRHARPPRKERK